MKTPKRKVIKKVRFKKGTRQKTITAVVFPVSDRGYWVGDYFQIHEGRNIVYDDWHTLERDQRKNMNKLYELIRELQNRGWKKI